MQSLITLKRFCVLCFILPFLTSCGVNAYTSPTQDDNASSFSPQDNPIFFPCDSENDTLFWDLSQTDISQIDQTKKLISFTFDDAPKPSLEPILAVFASFNEENPDCKATATLFCNGCFFNNATLHTVKAAHALGWELGNHAFSHVDLTKLSKSELLLEIDKTDELLSGIDGKPRHLFRPPFGEISDEIKTAVDVPVINWTIDTKDWTGRSADKIYDEIMQKKFSGAIVLMHDGHYETVHALKRLLPDLKAQGYQVTSVSQMAKAHNCSLKKGGVYVRARKNGTK